MQINHKPQIKITNVAHSPEISFGRFRLTFQEKTLSNEKNIIPKQYNNIYFYMFLRLKYQKKHKYLLNINFNLFYHQERWAHLQHLLPSSSEDNTNFNVADRPRWRIPESNHRQELTPRPFGTAFRVPFGTWFRVDWISC